MGHNCWAFYLSSIGKCWKCCLVFPFALSPFPWPPHHSSNLCPNCQLSAIKKTFCQLETLIVFVYIRSESRAALARPPSTYPLYNTKFQLNLRQTNVILLLLFITQWKCEKPPEWKTNSGFCLWKRAKQSNQLGRNGGGAEGRGWEQWNWNSRGPINLERMKMQMLFSLSCQLLLLSFLLSDFTEFALILIF